MINEKMLSALNEQINKELYSGYLYLAMSAYFSSINLNGFANWMRVQEQEERAHAMKIYDYVLERGGEVSLEKIDEPPKTWDSPLAIFEEAYKHEIKVTESINNLVYLARDLKDNATEIFLQWFVTEQVEEEASADEIVQKLKQIGENTGGLFMLDQNLGQRTFTPIAADGE
jgi:ferritin